MKQYSILFFIAILITSGLKANISLPAIFGDHMVLKQNSTVTIWGWAKPGEEIVVTPSWNDKESRLVVGNDANWALQIETPQAGGPYEISLKGYNQITIHDVLIGEVWLCSGQSNMEWSARLKIDNGDQHVEQATNNQIRFFAVTHRSASNPNYDIDGRWMVCSPQTMIDFSAIAYFFGNRLQTSINTPVGLINSSWGGTPIEVWIPTDKIANDPFLSEAAQKVPEMGWSPRHPGVVYNAMIAPFNRFALSGAIWYQGESNVCNTYAYTKMMETLIGSWRESFNQSIPFIFAQIAPYNQYGNHAGVELREAQRKVPTTTKGTAMVVVSDIGDTADIHPRKKYEAGVRLANVALNMVYNHKEVACYGPQLKTVQTKGNRVIISFEHAKQLNCTNAKPSHFELAGPDGIFHKATASIKENQVIVTSPKVKTPTMIRHEWQNAVIPDLFNESGLPASSFKAEIPFSK